MESALWIIPVLGLLCWSISWAMFAGFRAVPPAAGAGARRVSVIIPARNEENNLGRLLASLRSQPDPPHEIIVVDDQSEDGTADCAREHGARVVSGTPMPEGWIGKPWACQQGADAADGDWFLFLDADTEIEPGGLERLLALGRGEDEVHSVCPYHKVRAPYEQLSAFFNAIMLLGMNAFTLKGARAREIGLFGQVLLVSRRRYEAVGGHGPVRGEVLENFHLARDFVRSGATCHCWLGLGTISMRMFPEGCRDLVAGWSKGFVSGAGNTARGALAGVSMWISGLFVAAIGLAMLPLGGVPVRAAIAGVYALYVLQVYFVFRKAGRFSFWSALAYPVGLVFYHVVFVRALWRLRRGGTIRWKGRDVG
ncbi:MAG: glycosyltransferase [Akkermansiaceae bacterium]|nr:glycosyltransferase [Akkermansiaceae bacterium]